MLQTKKGLLEVSSPFLDVPKLPYLTNTCQLLLDFIPDAQFGCLLKYTREKVLGLEEVDLSQVKGIVVFASECRNENATGSRRDHPCIVRTIPPF